MTEGSDYATVVGLLRAESEAIDKAASRLQAGDIDRVIEILANCKGKIVLLGTGKSGIIAQKIAATMTSSGTAAINLHPSDAGHGGLGILTSDDVVLMLSNSGETDELPDRLRRRLGVADLTDARVRGDAIVRARTAEEVPMATAVGLIARERLTGEAPPKAALPGLKLVSSWIEDKAAAELDALAMTLMQAKGLTAEDFASNHPAGQLGKRLTLRVADLMHSGAENPTIATDASWMDVVSAITHYGLGAVNVIDSEGRLKGIITDGDLRRSLQRIGPRDFGFANLRCDDLMTSDPVVTNPEMLAFAALRLMEDRPSQINVLPVIDGDRLCVGLIRLHDIVRSGL